MHKSLHTAIGCFLYDLVGIYRVINQIYQVSLIGAGGKGNLTSRGNITRTLGANFYRVRGDIPIPEPEMGKM